MRIFLRFIKVVEFYGIDTVLLNIVRKSFILLIERLRFQKRERSSFPRCRSLKEIFSKRLNLLNLPVRFRQTHKWIYGVWDVIRNSWRALNISKTACASYQSWHHPLHRLCQHFAFILQTKSSWIEKFFFATKSF